MKKIISFSLWGSKPIFSKGAIENVTLAKKYYPGWICRFYYDKTVPESTIKALGLLGAETIKMPLSDGNFGLFWRFDVWSDPTVERFLIRDTDSRLGAREADAVREWIESDKGFHMMRDHYMYDFQIMGGLWGAVPSKLKINYASEIQKWLKVNSYRAFLNKHGKWWNLDQRFLQEIIWSKVINNSLIHSSVPDVDYGGKIVKFKVENEDKTYVGKPYGKPQRLPDNL